MSDLEAAAFFVSEFRNDVTGFREQFPLLPRELTQEIAHLQGHKHPRAPGSEQDIVMTTDQVWTVTTADGTTFQPVSVKYTSDLQRRRVKEKLSMETSYWARITDSRPLFHFTEQSASKNFVRNWSLIRSTLRPDYFNDFPERITERVDSTLRPTYTDQNLTLDDLCACASQTLGVARGAVLAAIHRLIASRTWSIDLDLVPLSPQCRLTFLPTPVS